MKTNKPFVILTILCAIIFSITGCGTVRRKSYSLHEIQKFNEAGKLVYDEVWRDKHNAGGRAFLDDQAVSNLSDTHTNQNALGGGAGISVQSASTVVSTNASGVITASGDAAGKLAGELIKTSVNPAK